MNLRSIITTIEDEPYRVFFPLGIIAGILGVSLWPLWFAGRIDIYPGPAHSRLMVEGFFTAFIFGFLGTAGPRMLGVKSFSIGFWSLIGILWLGAQTASLIGASNLAEGGFATAILCFLIALGQRFPHRSGLPPPGFILVLTSLLGAFFAALTQMPVIQNTSLQISPFVWILGRNFLTETYILLPILGAAPFFFGRFGNLTPKHIPSDEPTPPHRWKEQATYCLATGIMLLAAMFLKTVGMLRSGAILQGIVITVFVATQIPWQYPKPVSTLARIAQIALLCLVIAPLAEAIWPQSSLAWRHLLLISGFQWIVVCVATWVAFAHAGRRLQCLNRWPVLQCCLIGWILAVVSRMIAEWVPSIHDTHLIYAALLWIASCSLWLGLLIPSLRSESQ